MGQLPVSDPNTATRKSFPNLIIIIVIALGFVAVFFSGYFLQLLLGSESSSIVAKPKQTSPTPTVKDEKINPEEQITTKFIPGKHYFDDTIMVVSKQQPNITLIATAVRAEQESGYVQNTRASFFNGTSWVRKTGQDMTKSSAVFSNNLLKKWVTTFDESGVLKESSTGEFDVNNKIGFKTGTLQNEISIRSQPGYTKFISSGDGILTVNDQNYPANVLYTRIYSMDASQIQTYNTSLGLTTYWLAFWGDDGTFYHLDSSSVNKPTSNYHTHKIGVFKNATGPVTKTFSANIEKNDTNPPSQYKITFNDPINSTLNFGTINSLNKAPSNSYNWFISQVKGTILDSSGKKVEGIGLVEYISD